MWVTLISKSIARNFNVRTLSLYIFLVVTLPITVSNICVAAQTVYWGGVGFSGEWSERGARYPNSSKLLCRASACPDKNLSKAAREALAKKAFANFKMNFKGVPVKQPEALVGVVVISNETFNVVKEDANYLHTYRIFANFLLYEVDTGKIFQSVPVIVRYTNNLPQQATPEQNFEIFRHLALGDNEKIKGLMERVYSVTKNIQPTMLPGKYVQISNFDFSSDAKASFASKNPASLNAQFAQFFEGELVGRTKAHMIPSAADNSVVAGRIKATFEDGERELALPDAAVKIGVMVRMAKRFEKINGPQRTVCHAVALTLTGQDGIGPIASLKFAIFADACGVTNLTRQFDPTHYFSRSLYSLLQNMTKQIASKEPSAKWIKRNARGNDGKDVAAELIKLRKQAFSLLF